MIDLSRVPAVTLQPEDEAWLTGFTEGDGWISYDSANGKFVAGYEQKERQVLDGIQAMLAPWSQGSLFPVSWGGYRLQYSARYFVYGLIVLLSRHIVTKKWSELLNVPQTVPDLPWVAGFWEAEGHSGIIEGGGMHKNLFIGISQKDPKVLVAIQALIGTGSVHPLQVVGKETHIWNHTFTPHRRRVRSLRIHSRQLVTGKSPTTILSPPK